MSGFEMWWGKSWDDGSSTVEAINLSPTTFSTLLRGHMIAKFEIDDEFAIITFTNRDSLHLRKRSDLCSMGFHKHRKKDQL